jgi:hypothetical protein
MRWGEIMRQRETERDKGNDNKKIFKDGNRVKDKDTDRNRESVKGIERSTEC